MRHIASFAFVALLVAATASAGIITTGTWSQAFAPCDCGDTPYSNRSLDGPELNAGYVLARLLRLPTLAGVEYLSAPDGFTIEGAGVVTEFFSRTAYQSVMTILSDGVVHLTDGRGNAYDSVGAGREHFNAWRLPSVATALGVSQRVFWCGEDLEFPLLSLERGSPTYMAFGDCNDRMQATTFFTPTNQPPICLDCAPTPNIPEPSVLLLSALAVAGCARRWRRV